MDSKIPHTHTSNSPTDNYQQPSNFSAKILAGEATTQKSSTISQDHSQHSQHSGSSDPSNNPSIPDLTKANKLSATSNSNRPGMSHSSSSSDSIETTNSDLREIQPFPIHQNSDDEDYSKEGPEKTEGSENVSGVPIDKTVTVKSNMSEKYIDPEMRPPVFKSTFHEILCIALVALAPAAASMSGSAFQVSLREISKEFGENGGKLTWSVSSVMLANGSCLLLMGGVADAFGRRNALVIGYFGFAVFSLIAGFMHNFILLCFFRALMGVAVSCGTPAAAGFLGSTYKDSKRKNMVMSCFGIGPPAGGASGYFVGGVCLVVLNWRSIHYFLSIIFLILSVLVAFTLPEEKKIDWAQAKQIFKKLDYIGALISLSAFVLICFALTQVDATPKRWKTPYIIATLIVGIFLVGVFVLYESKVPTNPLMPMKMFTTRNFNLSMMITALSWMIFFGFLNYDAILYFEDIKNYKTMVVACCFLTQPIAGTLVNIFAGFTMHIIPVLKETIFLDHFGLFALLSLEQI
ncbi:unnamed protein product [Ambrosiozyma monospora]|uniref:Unnamed protein product n=1 Tax=Ambrosiozyma monospora TaxID=43982 RepID=A0ACB5T524_AMBMO|nr:unnamed protein product [Ambrosiozyma monospora]